MTGLLLDRIRDLQQLLAKILASKQPLQGIRNVVEPLLHIDLKFQLARPIQPNNSLIASGARAM